MWQYLTYSPEYLENMLNMTRAYYGDIEIANKNYIQHQYFENPAGDATIELAYDYENDRLAGQYIAIPNRIFVAGKVYPILLSLNTLTDEHYRGQGIFTKLAEKLYTNHTPDFIGVYGLPNQNSFPGFIGKLRCRNFGSIPLFLRPLKPSNLVKERFHSSVLSTLARPFDFNYRVQPVSLPSNLKIVEINQDNLFLADDLWNSVKEKYPVIVVRDSTYIKWRYIDVPMREYRVCVLMDSDRVCALAVGRVTQVADMECGMLVDFITLPGCEAMGLYLIRDMLRFFKRQGADIAGCLMKNEASEAKLLKKCGFFPCPKFLEPQPFPMILRIFRKNMEQTEICNFADWFFTMGDYDVI